MLFIHPDDENFKALPIVVSMLFYVGLFQLVDGMQVIAGAKLRGLMTLKFQLSSH